MSRRPYRLVSSKRIYQGHIIELVLDRFIYKAAPKKIVRRELIRHPGAVVILPFLTPKKILLVNQFRWAAKGNLWEIPAGTMERGEKPLTCAKRELEEETGYRAKKWTLLTSFYSAPGMTDEIMWLYRAEGLTQGTRDLDPDEWMDTHPTAISQALRMIRSGLIRDAKTIAGILWDAALPR